MTYYDDIAEGYENLHKEEQEEKISIIVDIIKNKFIPNIGLNEGKKLKIADIGCGPYFADFDRFFDCEVYGFDPSEKLVDIAKKKIDAKVGSAEDIELEDRSVDITVSITASQNFIDMDKALSEIYRVTKYFALVSIIGRSSRIDELRESSSKAGFEIIDEFADVKDHFFVLEKSR